VHIQLDVVLNRALRKRPEVLMAKVQLPLNVETAFFAPTIERRPDPTLTVVADSVGPCRTHVVSATSVTPRRTRRFELNKPSAGTVLSSAKASTIAARCRK
jgi:hypothetical protein